MGNWLFVGLLHNLSLQEPVENKYVAIVPDTDTRAVSLVEASPALRRLVSGFTDQFGRSTSPSLMIVHPKVPKRILTQDALIGFRNAVAICSIVKAWEEELVRKLSLNVLKYSNYFDLHPISVGKDGDELIIRSPSILGIDEPEDFIGQTSPGLASHHRETAFYDVGLLEAILFVWEDRFLRHGVRDWHSHVLFRSLEMAFHASTIPFENTSTIYDYGVKIALWVSAFELLASSKTKQIKLSDILDLLGNSKLYTSNLNKKLYTINFSDKNRKRGSLPKKLYHMLHLVRHDFLHGNPVKLCNIFINGSTKYHPLTSAAPILYKLALRSFLNIPKLPKLSDYENDMIGFVNVRNFEEAIESLIRTRPQRKGRRTKVSSTRPTKTTS
jgi:hypothetical protein